MANWATWGYLFRIELSKKSSIVDFEWAPNAFDDLRFFRRSRLKLMEFPLLLPWFKKLPILSRMVMTCFSSTLSSIEITARRNYCRLSFSVKNRSVKLNFISRHSKWDFIPGTVIIFIKNCSSLVNS